MYLADCHTHSHCSHDAQYSMTEMARGAVEAGLQEICLTDHVDLRCWNDYVPRERYDWSPHVADYRRAVAQLGGQVVIRLGAELGEAVTDFSLAEQYLADMQEELDFVIGSLHQMGERYGRRDLYFMTLEDLEQYDDIIDAYLEDLLRHAQWGKFDVMGHLTLPLRYLTERLGVTDRSFRGHEDQVREVLKTLIQNGRGIECNVNRGGMPLPDREFLTMYRQLGGEIITLGSDAHKPGHVGKGIREGQDLLKQCGFSYFCTFEKRKPIFHTL